MPVLPHDRLISETSRDRWVRWQIEMLGSRNTAQEGGPALPKALHPQSLEHEVLRHEHMKKMEEKVWASIRPTPPPDSSTAIVRSISTLASPDMNSIFTRASQASTPITPAALDGTGSAEDVSADYTSQEVEEDRVTDTVGAIAIDMYGNIACGASSGGIGMKQRGRLGPAAIVGVGASVQPVDPDDASQTCVAAVTSGTGEHMISTMAAHKFTDRMYSGLKKKSGAATLVPCENDDEIIASVIENEFMGQLSPAW